MSLFDKFVGHLFRRGEITMILADGTRRTYGAPDPSLKPVTLHSGRRASKRPSTSSALERA